MYLVSPVDRKAGHTFVCPTKHQCLAIMRNCVMVIGDYRLSCWACALHEEAGGTAPHIACYMVTFASLLFTRSKWYQCTLNNGS